MPKVITLLSKNPEVGKSTTLVNLATWISLLGKRVLLIDMSPNLFASYSLGVNSPQNQLDFSSVIRESMPLDMSILNTQLKDLSLIIGNHGSEIEWEAILEENIFTIRDQIDLLEESFDYIFIDIPSSPDIYARSALAASDAVILGLLPEAQELDTIPELIDEIVGIKENLNQWLELQGILITMFTESSFSRQVIMKGKERFGNLMFKTVIPRNMQISEANNSQKPIALYDIKSFGADSYLRLAREFMHYHEINV